MGHLLYLMFWCDMGCDGKFGNFGNFVGTKHTIGPATIWLGTDCSMPPSSLLAGGQTLVRFGLLAFTDNLVRINWNRILYLWERTIVCWQRDHQFHRPAQRDKIYTSQIWYSDGPIHHCFLPSIYPSVKTEKRHCFGIIPCSTHMYIYRTHA